MLRPHVAIVLVHPVAGGDRLAGEADDLAEFPDRLAYRDRLRRHLVAEWDALTSDDALGRHGVLFDALAGDQDIVLDAEAKHARIRI